MELLIQALWDGLQGAVLHEISTELIPTWNRSGCRDLLPGLPGRDEGQQHGGIPTVRCLADHGIHLA